MMDVIKKRNSSIELLRIIIMIMIILCHFASHGGFSFDNSITIPRLWWNIIEMGGNLGVDVFVIISGFYLIKNDNFDINWKKIIKLWGSIIFYSLSIYIVLISIGLVKFNISNIPKVLFPVIFNQWWFASTYFVLYIIHPFLNKYLLSIEKKQYQLYLFVIIILWSIIPTITSNCNQSNSLIEFIMLYSIAGYINKYNIKPNYKAKEWLIVFVIVTSFVYLTSIAIMLVGLKISYFSNLSIYFYSSNSIFTIIQAISLFMTFINIKINNNKIINKIASTTFGVYLIHDNDYLRHIIWKDIFKSYSYQNTYSIIIYSILVALTIFIVCSIVDLIRQKLFEKPYLKFTSKICLKIEYYSKTIVSFIYSIID